MPCQGQNTLQLETDERQIISSEYVITKFKSTYMIRHLHLFLGVFLKIKSCCCFDIIGSNLWIQILLYPVIFLNLVLQNIFILLLRIFNTIPPILPYFILCCLSKCKGNGRAFRSLLSGQQPSLSPNHQCNIKTFCESLTIPYLYRFYFWTLFAYSNNKIIS